MTRSAPRAASGRSTAKALFTLSPPFPVGRDPRNREDDRATISSAIRGFHFRPPGSIGPRASLCSREPEAVQFELGGRVVLPPGDRIAADAHRSGADHLDADRLVPELADVDLLRARLLELPGVQGEVLLRASGVVEEVDA
jgi:hypothetical protein